jgi:RimJ/RimL family protein N-acetyltransferase
MHLADETITLLPFDESDFELFLEISTCPQIMRHVGKTLTYDEVKLIFKIRLQPWNRQSDGWLLFCITEIANGEKLGSIGLRILNHDAKIAEIGFLIRVKAQGRGIANSALTILKEYAYYKLTINKLVAFCSVDNLSSYKLLEKQGFVREGCLKQNNFINNQYTDDYIYGLCKSAL